MDSFLSSEGFFVKKTHLLFEKRGKSEDGELKSGFRRLCEKNREEGREYPFGVAFMDKKANHLGLQLVDLLARPIGLTILRSDQKNGIYEVMEKKLLLRLFEIRMDEISGFSPEKQKGPGISSEGLLPTGNPQSQYHDDRNNGVVLSNVLW